MYAYMNTHTYDRDKQCNKSESENIYICFLRNIPNFYIYVNLIYTYFVTCIHTHICACVVLIYTARERERERALGCPRRVASRPALAAPVRIDDDKRTQPRCRPRIADG